MYLSSIDISSHLLLESCRNETTQLHKAVVDAISAPFFNNLYTKEKMSHNIMDKC